MIIRLSGILSLSLVLYSGFIMAQATPAFSSDPALFVAELEALFSQAPARQQQPANRLISNLKQGFNTGTISSSEQQSLIAMTNRMNEFRLRPFPHFFSYFSAAMAYLASSPERENFLNWNKSIYKLIGEINERRLQNYLEQCEVFFRQGILFRTNSVQWRTFEGEWAPAPDSVPAFHIRDAVLRCYASRDSISVYNASGLFRPNDNEWIGTRGRINWERAGYNADDVYADLRNYSIILSSSHFSADSAMMRFPRFFNRTLPGSLNHRVVAGSSPATDTYPRFYSYNVFLEVRNVFQGIDFTGGFGLEGNRIIGFGKQRENAMITIRKDGEPIVKFTSHSFVIRSDRITAQRATFCLYLESDSIYHPGLQMRYNDFDRELMLLRTGDGLAQSPYFNSYHHLDMSFEALYWKLDDDYMSFGAMRGLSRSSEAIFESANFFSHSRFNRIQGADRSHPLIIISSFIYGLNSSIFYHEDLASHMNMSIDQVSAMLISLANQGFIQYSPDDGRVVIKDRVKHYIDAVNDRSDYDVIRIQSEVEGLVNARLRLNNFDLDIYGVPEVYLSNTQQVFVYPSNSTISIKKGLDFLFKGRINAGYFEFYAQESAFLYDEFKINLTHIDSLSFNVPALTDLILQRGKLERVKTVISNISGDLLIDNPENKSGRESYPRYPIFDSKNESFVYFDQSHIQKGVYHRDNFYYHILPFTIDSLNNFTTAGMSFNGYLFSGGVFPDIEEPLRVQPDYSLGFVKPISNQGLPLYDEKALAYTELSLSHKGLRGGGRIEFLSSVSYSDDFIFHPDSMMATLHEFKLEETIGHVSYPAVFSKDVEMKWLHGDDRMVLRNTKNMPFEMYDSQLVHKGTLTFRSSGLYGSGEVFYSNATFRSPGFSFYNRSFGSNNSTLTMASTALGTVFNARSYGFEFDLDIRQGSFTKAGKSSSLEFPLNRYLAYMDMFRWEVDYEEIHLSNDNVNLGSFIPGSGLSEQLDSEKFPVNFISLHRNQDSLRFNAGSARFDLREYYLDVQEVPYIEIADAAIFPIDGKVNIRQNAEMQPLQGANLIAGSKNRYHRLYNVSATIKGRNSFSAAGMYDYTNNLGQTQTINFQQITPDSQRKTTGVAEISDVAFSLSPYFDFIGKISFSSAKREFYYDGGFRIRHDCSEVPSQWVSFQGEVDHRNIYLPISSELYNTNRQEISSSVLFSLSDNKVYSGFLNRQGLTTDYPLFSAYGFISFDPAKQQYLISKSKSEQLQNEASNSLTFAIDPCVLSGEGTMDFRQDLGRVSMFNSGKVDHYILPDSTVFDLFSVVDFFFSTDALELLNQSLRMATDLRGIDPGNPLFIDGLKRLLGDADAQRLLSELNLYGTFRRFPRELPQTMIFSDLKLIWNKNTRSFTSFGPLGIMVLNNNLVNRYVDGHIELVRRRTGDILTIYLQPAPAEWYFFTYSGGIMQTISSNEEFNNQIMNLREDRRTLRARGDDEPYQFIISTMQQRNAFLRRVRAN